MNPLSTSKSTAPPVAGRRARRVDEPNHKRKPLPKRLVKKNKRHLITPRASHLITLCLCAMDMEPVRNGHGAGLWSNVFFKNRLRPFRLLRQSLLDRNVPYHTS